MPGAPFLEAVAGILDRRQDGVHPVVVDLFVLRVAERSVSECQQVQQFGAERILHQGIVHRCDQFLEAFVRRILEIDRLGDQYGFVHVRIGIQRLVGVLIGISVVEVVVVLLGHRVVARLIPQHQVRVVVGDSESSVCRIISSSTGILAVAIRGRNSSRTSNFLIAFCVRRFSVRIRCGTRFVPHCYINVRSIQIVFGDQFFEAGFGTRGSGNEGSRSVLPMSPSTDMAHFTPVGLPSAKRAVTASSRHS